MYGMCVPAPPARRPNEFVIVDSTIVVTTNNYKHVGGQPAHPLAVSRILLKTMHAHAYALFVVLLLALWVDRLSGKQRQ